MLSVTWNTPGGSTVIFSSGEQIQITASHELRRDGGSLLALGLLPAMRRQTTLEVTHPVPPGLLESVPALQQTYAAWWPDLVHVGLQAESGTSLPRASGVGCFFSGGLDSWYSILKNRERLTHLIHITGFDFKADNTTLANLVTSRLQEAAEQLGLPVIEVTIHGLREHWDTLIDLDRYFGAVLAAIAHLCSPYLGTVLIPAAHTSANDHPLGSHARLDPLWGSKSVQLIHDGTEATRVQKAALIGTSEIALRTLRVCSVNPSAYNCGTCEKCLRTMVNLRSVGALDRCTTFARPLSLRRVAWTTYSGESARVFILENLEAARARGDRELERALVAMLERRYYRGPLRFLRRTSRWVKWKWKSARLGKRAWQ